jgi:F0F1-type ATP synthase alpha subunit
VPVSRIADFEAEYLLYLQTNHADLMQKLKEGTIDKSITDTLEEVCRNIAKKYE